MANCTRCNVEMTSLGAETVDGVYAIHAWKCDDCGDALTIATAAVDAYDFPSFCLTEPIQPDWLTLLPLAANAHVELHLGR
ncbi:hypothetical protein NML43_00080 [Rhodopseudomonas palustris]|jgi:hypothetical protein|uniref:hypothetical protein n=1 Tax=Rhodopseudomonas TaxID=1073 RepID=UPI0006B9D534|nr:MULTISPECIES: hypothetical protein [Rhodopseudomonas]KPF96392.1 hypothetical protein IP86_16560 [Rhodopseudomonas sp. AAP120]MCP9625472.1 hypothetical protein [Rhodopseudomonas palustris]